VSLDAADITVSGSRSGPVGFDAERWASPAAGLLIAALTVYLGFNAGGFFPGAVAYATVAMAVLLVVAIMLVREPLTNSPPALLGALGAITGFAALTLLSGSWSHSWSRAIIEFDRVLFYVLVLAFFAMLRRRDGALEWGLRGFVVGAMVICIVAWVTRVAPDVWPISYDIKPQRLSFPLTYWNALGLFTAVAATALLHLTSADGQTKAMRVAAAALFPLFASVLLLTFSRSSLALAPLAIVIYLVLARPRRFPSALLAVAVPAGVAVVASLDAHTVSSARYSTPAGVSQGHDLALIVLICVVVAGLIRLAALSLDSRLDVWTPPRIPLSRVLAAVGVVVLALVVVGLAAGAPHRISTKWDHFVNENAVGHSEDPSARLSSIGNDGRIPQWGAAIDSFDEKPLLGKGAGTYVNQWLRHRPYDFTVINAHSLYIEVMGELGIVGLLLIIALMLAFLVGAGRRLRGSERQVYAAFLAMAVIWMIHAGIDWDWQMPAVTLWLFALGGIALSRPVAPEPDATEVVVGRTPRLVAALCVGVLAITPVVVALSQVRLESALSAFDANECSAAIHSSLDSLSALGVRPEPYEIIGYCDARFGEDRLAEEAMRSAVSRDPENWEMHYGLALVRAAAGKNPMPELREASRLNPLEPMVAAAVERFGEAKRPAQRERLAGSASLPL
jgi:O-antigen ligase